MGFPDYTIEGYQQSYLSQDRIFKFLNSYADHFDIRSLIKVGDPFYEIVCIIVTAKINKFRKKYTTLALTGESSIGSEISLY